MQAELPLSRYARHSTQATLILTCSPTPYQGTSGVADRQDNVLPRPGRALTSDGHDWIWLREGPTDRQILVGLLETLKSGDADAAVTSLFGEFGSISSTLDGSRHRLVKAVGRELAEGIEAAREVMKAELAERLAERPRLGGSSALMSCLRLDPTFFEQERLLVLYVDKALRLIRNVNLAEGSSSACAIDVAGVVREGLNLGAAGFMVIQNHPSGDLRPSRADRAVTERLVQAGSYLGIEMLDQFIIAGGKVWSRTGFVERKVSARAALTPATRHAD